MKRIHHAQAAAGLCLALAAAGCSSSGSGGDVTGLGMYTGGESPTPGAFKAGVDLIAPGPSGAVVATGIAEVNKPSGNSGGSGGSGGGGGAGGSGGNGGTGGAAADCQAYPQYDSLCTADPSLAHAYGCPTGAASPDGACSGPVAIDTSTDGYCCP